jgi:hypothetical protein
MYQITAVTPSDKSPSYNIGHVLTINVPLIMKVGEILLLAGKTHNGGILRGPIHF